ncbi:MAG: MerR family transcriptional regulator, partial [Anaerolineaceae bacterium]|nr:MerR family transcriptional regulator [Anaerolineaceae bacterium]
AVSSMLDLLPVTLRAWERRYGMPAPHRGEQGYRLYSPYDVRLLRWLKQQNDTGMSIGQAVKYLNELHSDGKDPVKEMAQEHEKTAETVNQVSLEIFSRHFQQYLMNYQNENASEILRRAFSIYNVDQVLTEVIQATLVRIGEAWHSGEIPIAVEHFATQFCEQHLMGMFYSSSFPTREGTIFAACAPGEMHQIGILSLVVILRWRGWDVKYFGQNLSLERIQETLTVIKPNTILFTATTRESALALKPLNSIIEKYPFEQPLVFLGGLAFQNYPELVRQMPGEILNFSPSKNIDLIEKQIYRKLANQKE